MHVLFTRPKLCGPRHVVGSKQSGEQPKKSKKMLWSLQSPQYLPRTGVPSRGFPRRGFLGRGFPDGGVPRRGSPDEGPQMGVLRLAVLRPRDPRQAEE